MKAKPFIKWVGGKRSLLPVISELMPHKVSDYYEPFLGGGAVFLHSGFRQAHLSDMNHKLVTTWIAIRDTPHAVIAYLHEHNKRHCDSYYYQMRDKFNDYQHTKAVTAALFVYLNRTGFNGLYRENASGHLNVPVGKYTNPCILDEVNIMSVHEALSGVDIVHRSFADTPVQHDAFYYFDPPYHDTFTTYTKGGFDEQAQTDVARLCKRIHDAGSKFMLSNSDTALTRELYNRYNIRTVSARRSVSANKNGRGSCDEILVTNY